MCGSGCSLKRHFLTRASALVLAGGLSYSVWSLHRISCAVNGFQKLFILTDHFPDAPTVSVQKIYKSREIKKTDCHRCKSDCFLFFFFLLVGN